MLTFQRDQDHPAAVFLYKNSNYIDPWSSETRN